MHRSFKSRMDALERARLARLTPLERAYELVERGVPPERWPDAELNAYCDERPAMGVLTTDELDMLIEAPEGEFESMFARLLEQHGYVEDR